MSTAGDSEVSLGSSSEIIPIRAAKKSDPPKSQFSNAASSPGSVLNSIIKKSRSGPRTLRGIERSKHNALKHGVFSSVLLIEGESKDAFDCLLNGLRDHFQPEGVLEDVLVEKLTTLLWCQRRVLVSEGAEIQKPSESPESSEEEGNSQTIRVIFGGCDQENADLLDEINDPTAVQKGVRLLEQLRDSVKADGRCPSKLEDILKKLMKDSGAKVSDLGWPETIVPWFSKREPAEGESENKGPLIPENMRELSVSLIEKKLAQFSALQRQHGVMERNRKENKRLRQQVPENPSAERLLRYEASLERSFDRTLSRLERIQRMRKGQVVPPPLKVDVSS